MMGKNEITKKIVDTLLAAFSAYTISYLIMDIGIAFDSFFLQMLFQFSIFSFAFGFCYYCISCLQKCEKRLKIFGGIFGILFSAGIVFGHFLRYRGYVFEQIGKVGLVFFLILGISIPSAFIFTKFCDFVERFTFTEKLDTETEDKKGIKRFSIKVFTIIMLAWIPVWLAFFPCIYGYDIYTQLYTNIYLGNYSSFQPIIHTLFLRFCFKVGRIVGSNVVGMAFYSIIQMSVLAGSITYALVFLKSKNIKGINYYIAWFALYPFHPIMAISTTKDIFFSAAVLILVVYIFQSLEKRKSIRSLWGMAFFTSIMLLFRNNAIYAFLLAWVIGWCIQKEKRKLYIILGFFIIVLTKTLDGGLMFLTSAESAPLVEMLCVPLQQMGRVGNLKGEEAVEEVLGERAIANYNPALADGVKGSLREGGISDLSEAFHTYITMGIKYPGIYLDAFLANTAGYWAIEDLSSTEIYGKGMEGRTGIVQLVHWEFAEEACNVKEYHLLPGIFNCYIRLFANNEYLKIPVFSMLFHMSIYTWLMIIYILFHIYKRRWKQLLPAAFLIGYFITLLLGPCVLVRYMYPIILSVPIFLAYIFVNPLSETA